MQRIVLFLPFSVALLLMVMFGVRLTAPETPPQQQSRMIGKSLPTQSIEQLNEAEPLSASDLKGRYVLLNVFASWCAVCTLEHPNLMALNHPELSLVGVNWKDKKVNANGWLTRHGNPYDTVIWDYDGRWVVELGVTGAPESFLVSPDGTIIYHYAGALTPQLIEHEILSRLP